MRTRELRDPVTITFDGDAIPAERGEPVAAALLASGKLVLARSSKFHRPRGPACFRGACDGCLARVNEQPNVMTCLVPAENGIVVASQNALGSREVDLLRVTDWFFPEGMNHHELFAGVPGVQRVMQVFARRVAGLGRLPKVATKPRTARRREADVVVVGAGPAGMAAATALAGRGRAVEVIDDALEGGGGARALLGEDAHAWTAIADAFAKSGASLRSATVAAGFYGDDLLVAGPGEEGAEIVTARAFVLAPGAHDGVLAFEGNDLPGVMSARAAGWLLARGVLVGKRVVVVVAEGGGPFGDAYARGVAKAGAPCEVTVLRGTPTGAHSGSRSARVKEATIDIDGKAVTRSCDALLVDAPRAPAYEVCAQAGAELAHEARGFVVRTKSGKIRDAIWALGEVTGTPLEPSRILEEALALASRI